MSYFSRQAGSLVNPYTVVSEPRPPPSTAIFCFAVTLPTLLSSPDLRRTHGDGRPHAHDLFGGAAALCEHLRIRGFDERAPTFPTHQHALLTARRRHDLPEL